MNAAYIPNRLLIHLRFKNVKPPKTNKNYATLLLVLVRRRYASSFLATRTGIPCYCCFFSLWL